MSLFDTERLHGVKTALMGSASAPGTCGELVQGSLDGTDFLVTCPIDLFSNARAYVFPGGEGLPFPIQPSVCGGLGVRVCAARAAAGRSGNREEKSSKAVKAALLRVFAEVPVFVEMLIDSALAVGRGMGSSTADIAASVGAASLALGVGVTPDFIADLALEIEPTDGTMFPGIYMFDHRKGSIRRPLGTPPPMDVLIVDSGETVDTVEFNLRPELASLNRKKEPMVREALELVRIGVEKGDPEPVGAGATLSSLANQAILPKEMLETVRGLARQVGAVGVNVAHSGSLIGILLDRRRTKAVDVEPFVRRRLPGVGVRPATIIGGGVRYEGR